jgi:hypothetical protein
MGVRLMNLSDGDSLVAIARNNDTADELEVLLDGAVDAGGSPEPTVDGETSE